MADHAFAGTSGNTSLRGLRERLVAVAQELAEERRRKRGINSSAVTSKRSSCTPVLDGSVLKNDIKQQLAKERREERKRQQEANKEKQLLEKQLKAKLQYEKQLEERHRKLKEQKEKDERRRVSAEEKRKQKQEEDKEKFKAVVSRTMERCNRADQRQKRWSWEGSVINADKSGKTESKRSTSLNRKDNQLHPSVDVEHVDTTPGMTKHVFRYVTAPGFTSDGLKSSAIFSKSSLKMPLPTKLEITPTKKIETSLKENMERPAKANAEVPSKMNMEEPAQANTEGPSKAAVEKALRNIEDISGAKVDISPRVNIEGPAHGSSMSLPESNADEFHQMNVDAASSVEPSPIVSEDSSLVLSTGSSSFMSVEISPVVSMDTSPELSIGSASATPSETHIGTSQTSLKISGELNLEAGMEAQLATNVEGPPQNSEQDNTRNENLTTKKQQPSHIPCYRWSSSPAVGCHPPSPMKAVRQNQKIRPPSPLPVSSRLASKTSLSYKITPVQNILYVPNALGTITKTKEASQKRMTNRESDNKSVSSSEVATKISIEIHHAAYEQKGKKEKEEDQQETKKSISRKSEGMVERVDEVPVEESSPCKNEQQVKDLTRRPFEPPEDQKQRLQKGDNTTMKSQDGVESRQKEQERIMLQNLQERLERKKRVEEIMKRTRKTDVNTSKASEISDNCPSEEDEADDEAGTESDEDSVEMLPSGMNTALSKVKKFHQNTKKKPQKLVFLQAGSGEVDSEKKVHFNKNKKAIKQNDPDESTSQAKSTKTPTKKQPTRAVRTRKTREANPTIRSAVSVTTNQEWVCGKNIDLSHTAEPPVPRTTAESDKQDSKDSVPAHQGPQVPLDPKKEGKPGPVPLKKVFSNLHLAGSATELENPFAPGCSWMAFGEGEDDSDT
ncbi:MAP7 domain-containing protein 3 isoform X2 [Arvicola amphibius]|uniref:MAP7 domain-containing protein 3 isoform X2 n=1 Tax=Arvicola amphibius TaxID=1047088 RepID=UPI0018E33A55|nr:MAP7 domain-containing protein 3 isoform X2 [Arvicola amphibius]